MIAIEIQPGISVQVDRCDVDLVTGRAWRLGTGGYVISDQLVDGQRYTCRLHRLVMGLTRGDAWHVDHVNRDKLDNRRTNLRLTTAQANNLNKGEYANAAGFAVRQRNGHYTARIRFRGVLHRLGTYETQEQATAVAREFRESLRV